ncbi:hypothetical protein [Phaeobacter sp. HF9A]|uniref:hypothetical protein n=1 Tax=Phaeobacter sp. HF9A TaxID=2721561 RepID=UPI0014303FF4|nr:hypothetical protein [Phaeobacter sp. HF9A]NIZ13387.1 hypothetical protein [Phaeobacter sp. HF9A]
MKIDLNQPDRLILKGTTSVISAVLCVIFLVVLGLGLSAAIAGVTAGWGIAAGSVFIGGGILWLVYHKTEVVFDRASNLLTLRKTMLHGTREENIALENVKQADVDLKRNDRSNNRLHASYTYRLCVVTGAAQNRHRVALSHGYTTSKRHLLTAQKINDWLGVPDAPIAVGPSMADVAEVIKTLGFGKAS